MCGIAGAVGFASPDEGRSTVRRMTRAIAHRGPDDEGEFAAEGVAFGMRRLSIIDLEGGHQPMWSASGSGIVFNGEIYNYRVLRRELESGGQRFETQSDTEVVLRLFDAHHLAALTRLEGMFAICLYDPARGCLHLARDRLGKKPLYYGTFGGVFYFASEIKAILAALPRRPELDRASLHHYLTLRYVPSPATIWQGIRKLEPGTVLTLDLATVQAANWRYWSLDFRSAALEESRDYRAEFERLFLASVEKRLVAADVPVGILLSGGIDSSAVAAAAVELGHRAFHTFSIAFGGGDDTDERLYARQVAERLGARHAEIIIDQGEFLRFLPQLVQWTDEPLADLAAVPLYFVSRLARAEVKVVLSGEGADELLAGYDFELTARRVDQLRRLLRIVPRPLLAAAATLIPGRAGGVLRDLARGGLSHLLARRAVHMTRDWTAGEKILLWREAWDAPSTDGLIRSWYAEAQSAEPLDQLQEVAARSWLVEDLLMKADRMSMANSLELRCPFLDHLLFEWGERLPVSWKVGDRAAGYSSKRILRDFAAARLPRPIIERPKRGFPVPAYRWLEGPLGEWAARRLLQGGRMQQWFRLDPIKSVLAAARRGQAAAQHKTWNLLILDHWAERWLGA